MATTPFVSRSTFPTSSGTLHTVTNPDKAIITNIIVVNENAASSTFTIQLDGVDLFNDAVIEGDSTVMIDLKQPIITSGSNKLIEGLAGHTLVSYHIAGVTYT